MSARLIRDKITSTQSHVVGFIPNDKAGDSERYCYYGSGYGYGPGYHGEDSDKEKSSRMWWKVLEGWW